jgi:hypothetical protein
VSDKPTNRQLALIQLSMSEIDDYAPIRGRNQTPTGIMKRPLKFDCVISFKLDEIGVGAGWPSARHIVTIWPL